MMQLEKPVNESDLTNAQAQFDEWLQKQKSSLTEERNRLQGSQKENENPMKTPKEDSALELTDARIAKTGINIPQKGHNPFDTDLTREAAHRRRLPRGVPSLSGGDLFAHRPTTAEVKDKQKRAYKAALDAQLASRRRGAPEPVRSRRAELPMTNPPTKHESIMHHPSFETLVNNPELNQTPRPTSQLAKQMQKSAAIQTPDIDDDFENVKVPTPRNIRQKSFDRQPPPHFQQPAPQVHIVHAPPAPQASVNPPVQQVYQQPPPPTISLDDSRLQAALEQATMNLQSTSAALTRTGAIAPANYGPLPTTTVQYSAHPTYQEQEAINTPRRVQINQHTPRVSYNEPQQFKSRGDGSNPNRTSANDYARMLREQIQHRQKEKQRIKNEENAYNVKKENEMKLYDPFGRGGAGAPVRGKDGQLMTDLRQMKFINKQLEDNVDLTFELKDVEQRNTPAPPSRIEQLEFERDESMSKPRGKSDIFGGTQKKDYNYMAYLEDEIRKKEDLKRRKKEQEELEAQLEEKRIMQEIEQLNRQAEEEKRREQEAKARKEQQKLGATQRHAPETKFNEPTGTGGHKTAKDNRKINKIDTSEWSRAEKELEEKIQRSKEAKQRSQSRQSQKTPRAELPRTPAHHGKEQSVRHSDHLHPPPTASYSSPAANQSYDQSVKSRSDELQRRTQFKTTPRHTQKEYRSRGRQSTTLSDISWDNRSEMNLYLDQPAPSRQSRHHYPTNHAVINTKALEEIDRMKEALQQELMHVQYNLDQKNRESKYSQNPVYNSSYPKPAFSAPPRHNLSARNRSIMAPPTDEQVRQNTQEYIDRTAATDDLSENDLVGIKNDDQIGDGAQLDVDTTFMTALPMTEKSIDIQTKQKEVHFPELDSRATPESSQPELDTGKCL